MLLFLNTSSKRTYLLYDIDIYNIDSDPFYFQYIFEFCCHEFRHNSANNVDL